MESVTLVGMRPRAVGNPIENLCSGVGSGEDRNLDSNCLPSLSAATGVPSCGKPPVPTSTTSDVQIQQLYDNQDSISHKLPNHDFNHDDIIGQNLTMKPLPTRLPPIQDGGGSKSDLSGVAVKRSATSVTLPMSPETAMKLYMHKLSPFEQHEIFDYMKVHFFLVCFIIENTC